MEKDWSYDYVHGTDVYVYQRRDMFRMNTDTSLLATFMRIEEGERVLDIGTNNGALLAVAHTFQPSYLYGVDIQEEAIALAAYNMNHLHIDNVSLYCEDVCTCKLPKMDVIICNPPYFKVEDTSALNASIMLRKARHEQYLTLPALCAKVSSLLEEKGRFYMVHRASRLVDIIHELRAQRLEVRTLEFVYDEAKEEAVSVLVEAIKDGKANCHVRPPKMITR